MDSFVVRYLSDCCSTYKRFADNPFSQEDQMKVNSGLPMPECVIEDMKRVFEVGKDQLAAYITSFQDSLSALRM